jgi:4-hydroxy-tetrahydrodipicolinate synthase
VSLFNRLVREVDQLVMLKHEEWPGLNKLSRVRSSAEKEGLRRVSVLVGNGGLYLPQELKRGADGAMTGFAYPEMLVDVVRLHREGEIDRAEDLFDAYLPLVRHEQQPGFGLALRKEVLHRRGAIASPTVRAPGPTLNSTDHEELTRLINRVETNLKSL